MKKQIKICLVIFSLFISLISMAQNNSEQELIEKATLGNPEAQLKVGDNFYKKKDYIKALEWWSKAAAQGIPAAEYQVAYCYLTGEGIEKNATKAFECFSKAATKNYASAQHALAIMYGNGDGVDMNRDLSWEWEFKAAENGSRDAQLFIGEYYFKSAIDLGQSINNLEKKSELLTKAIKWLSLAAAQGEVTAQLNLANYYNQWGSQIGNSLKYIIPAAKQGNKIANEMFQKITGISFSELDSTYKSKIKTYTGDYPIGVPYPNSSSNCTYQYYEVGYQRIFHGKFQCESISKKGGMQAPYSLKIEGEFKDDYRDGAWKIKYIDPFLRKIEIDVLITYLNGIPNGTFQYQEKETTTGKILQLVNAEYKNNILIGRFTSHGDGSSLETEMDENGYLHGKYTEKSPKFILEGDFEHGVTNNLYKRDLQTGEAVKVNLNRIDGVISAPWGKNDNIVSLLHEKYSKGVAISTKGISIYPGWGGFIQH